MPDMSSQTETPCAAKRFKNYYDSERTKKWSYRKNISQILEESDLVSYCAKIGLKLSEIKFSPNDPHVQNVPTKLTIAPLNISEEDRVLKWMSAKDLLNMSDKKYVLLRKFLKKYSIDKLPCVHRIKRQRITIDNSFILYNNDFGFFWILHKKLNLFARNFWREMMIFVKVDQKKSKLSY